MTVSNGKTGNTYRVIAYDLISCLDNYRYLGEFVEGYPFDTAEDKVTPDIGFAA